MSCHSAPPRAADLRQPAARSFSVALIWLALATTLCGCARTFTTRGVIIDVQPSTSQVTISHDAVPGLMDAMVMPFEARRTALDGLEPGDRVEFRLVVRGGRTRVDRLRILSAARRDTGLLSSPATRTLAAVGAVLPDFTLTDQNGATVSLASLRGQVVAVTFIYTRCPLPDYCPRMVTNFKAVAARLGRHVGRDVTLLTITFDPKHDTPATLHEYAERFGALRPGWSFLTGAPDAIERVCAAFGLEYWPEEGLITHTLQTAVIDREGRLAATIEGKDYSPAQVVDLIEAVLGRKS